MTEEKNSVYNSNLNEKIKYRGASGNLRYNQNISDMMVKEVYDYLKKQDDIIEFIKTNPRLAEEGGKSKEDKIPSIEHPDLSSYLKDNDRHWKAIQKIFELHDINLDMIHTVDKNETITAKKRIVREVVTTL